MQRNMNCVRITFLDNQSINNTKQCIVAQSNQTVITKLLSLSKSHQYPIVPPGLLPPDLDGIRKDEQPTLIRTQRVVVHMQRHIVTGRDQQIGRHVRLARIGGHIVPNQVAHAATAAVAATTATARFVLFGGGGLAIALEQRGVAGAAVPPAGLGVGFGAEVFAHEDGFDC